MEATSNKIISRLRPLLVAACLLSGLLAGENIFRYAMEVPAWRHIPIDQWGEYSRHADLGNGVFLLPFEAIASAILLLIASVILTRQKEKLQAIALPVHAATLLALIGLVLTFFAAPYMLSLRSLGNDPVLLQQAFDHFHHWGFFRAIAQVLSFCCCVLFFNQVLKTSAH